jgi:importin subunit alpha-6/7
VSVLIMSHCFDLVDLFIVVVLGLDKIEFLQTHEKTEIYERAFSILQEYYGNDEEDAGVAPSTQNNEFQFTNQPVTDSGFQF